MMEHPLVVIDRDVDDASLVDDSGVVWLPASRRVEGRLVEHHDGLAVLRKALDDDSRERGEMRVLPVEFCCHSEVTHIRGRSWGTI